MSKLSITRPTWLATVAALPVHLMSWEQLRAAAVFEPSRRVWAWMEMTRRSNLAHLRESDIMKRFGRERGH